MRPNRRTLFAPIFLGIPMLLPAASVDPTAGQLILFHYPAETAAAIDLEAEWIGKLEEKAAEIGAGFSVVDVEERGAPPEVHLAPLLVFQNHKGRSIFQGRYTDLGNVEHFVRTSRFIPREMVTVRRDNLPAMTIGRTTIAAPIKVTPLDGEIPADHDSASFHQEALSAIPAGFRRLAMQETTTLGRSDRLFYMDFYPIAIENEELVISLALFSQFDCHTPVYTAYEDQIRGPMAERERLWADAAAMLEAEIMNQMRNSIIGDGFVPLDRGVETVSWEELGLALPPPPDPATRTIPEGVDLPRRWEILNEQIDGMPLVTFRFASPLDSYTGTARQLSGEFVLGEGNSLFTATGHATVPIGAVTMGIDELDAGIHQDMLINAFPQARFEIDRIDSDEVLTFAAPQSFTANGRFTMMGVEVPLRVTAEADPVVADDGTPRLLIAASFQLSVSEPFNLEGPPGPAPENHTLEFFLRFPMVEKRD